MVAHGSPEQHHAYYEAHKEKIRADVQAYAQTRRKEYQEHNRLYRRNLRREVLSHYSEGLGEPHCVCCGETQLDFLVLDHADGNGAQHRREVFQSRSVGTDFYLWLRRNNYPTKFRLRILCANCNMAARYGRTCPHDKPIMVG